jgi:hypothetical protein
MPEPLFTQEFLPDLPFVAYRKTRLTFAVRIQGRFHCVTSEGNVASCEDGWLAIDSRGFPYPINAAEFDDTYVAVERGAIDRRMERSSGA